MSTAVRVNTAAHAATHVATNLVRSVRALVKGCGLDTARLVGQWEVLESGVSIWLASRHLRALTLEVFDPNRKTGDDLVGRFDFTIDYGYYADGDGDLWFDPDSVAYAIRKNGAIPARCDYRLVADNAPRSARRAGLVLRLLQVHRRLHPPHDRQHDRRRQPRREPGVLLPEKRMITVNEAFRIFRTRLETTDTEDATASRRQRRLREQLDATLEIHDDFLTGSYVRHTKTKPLRDVDIMIVLEDTSYLKRHPHEILEEIRAVLAEYYGDHRVCIDRRAVRVDFGAVHVDELDGEIITFDVVPAFKDGQDYLIPDEVLGTWVPTNPRTHAELATAANKAFDGQWKPLVKMIKRWNKTAGCPIEPSFLLEVMGLALMVAPWSGQHAYEIRQFFASAADRIADRWPDPAHLGPDVSDLLDGDPAKMTRARTALRAAEATATRAIQADRQGRTGEALSIWRSLFGEAFPTS